MAWILIIGTSNWQFKAPGQRTHADAAWMLAWQCNASVMSQKLHPCIRVHLYSPPYLHTCSSGAPKLSGKWPNFWACFLNYGTILLDAILRVKIDCVIYRHIAGAYWATILRSTKYQWATALSNMVYRLRWCLTMFVTFLYIAINKNSNID